MNLLFVVNPISGGRTKKSFLKQLHKYMKLKEHRYELYFTTKSLPVDSNRLSKILNDKYFDRVVAVGGDGTVRLVARNLINKNIGMGIVPFGSANGMARELELPFSANSALVQTVESKKAIAIDILHINEEYYCFHLCDVGTNALLVNKHHNETRRGLLGYAKNLYKSATESHKFKSYIKTKEGTTKFSGYNLTIGNARRYGIGTTINTIGKLDDGKFEMVCLKNLDLQTILTLAISIFSDSTINNVTDLLVASEAQIVFSSPQDFHIDGEPMPSVDKLSVRVIKHAIQFYC